MRTDQKRFPTLADTDPMPFGQHKRTPMQDVPPAYLAWLWEQGSISNLRVANYIWNSKEAIELELGKEI